MKKSLIVILFLFLVACSPSLANHPTGTPDALELATPSPLPSVLAPTKTPRSTSIALPSPTPTLAADNIVERVYDPGEWKPLYNKDTVNQIELDPRGMMWVSLSGGEVGYFDDIQWIFFSQKDYLLPSKPFDMAIAPNGAVWLAGRNAISRYQHGRWKVFPMPGVNGAIFPRLAIDSSGTVWVAMMDCRNCGNSLSKFDGKNWSDLWLWTTERTLHIPQILFTSDGTLWAADDGGEIGRYNGKTWKSYSEMDLWSTDDYATTICIASDNKGNIFGVFSGQHWITKIDTNGQISKIQYPTNLQFNETLLRLFVDRQNRLWANACLKDYGNSCLAYYRDNQWVFFTDLPFTMVDDIEELPDGTLLFATWQGLYQYKSDK